MKLRIKIIILLLIIGIFLSGCISNTPKSAGNDKNNVDIDNAENITTNEGINNEEDINITDIANETEENINENETIANETIADETIADETIENETEEEIVNDAHIESVEGYIISPEKLKIKLLVYNNENKTIKYEGTLDAILYEKIEDSDEGSSIGNELDRWTLQIKESDYGQNNELIKELEFHNKNVTSPSRLGYMDYTFTTKYGVFETADEFINLTSNS